MGTGINAQWSKLLELDRKFVGWVDVRKPNKTLAAVRWVCAVAPTQPTQNLSVNQGD